MKHTVEALHESAVALDHHMLRDRDALRIAGGIAVANCMLLAGAVTVHSQHENRETQESIPISEASANFMQLGTVDAPEIGPNSLPSVPPRPKPTPKKVASHAVKPTGLTRSSYNWRSVTLASNPQTVPGDQYQNLLRLVSEPKALTDISHPQCSGPESDNFKGILNRKPMAQISSGLAKESIAVIGVTGGRPFTSNRCLKNLAAVADSYDFYVNSSNPGVARMQAMLKQGPFKCKAYDTGCVAEAYGQMTGNYAVQLVKSAGLTAPHGYWWIDVETENTWPRNAGYVNRRILTGIIKALRAAHPEPKIGFYSVPKSIKFPNNDSQWETITGVPKIDLNGIVLRNKKGKPLLEGWLNGYDAWIATGSKTQARALAACEKRKSFTGGRIVMSQHIRKVNGVKVDDNVLCP